MADKLRMILGASACALIAACASAGPSPELVDARRAYDQANRSRAAELAPHEVLEARNALERAEAAHADEPGSALERNLAYLAHREALEAIAEGEIAEAKLAIRTADRQYRELAEAERVRARNELERARRDLASTAQELATVRSQLQTQGETLDERTDELREQEKLLLERKAELEKRTLELAGEREARLEAEKAAAAALASLQEVARVQEDQRGTVITLSGSVLFASNKSELLPIARQTLTRVAEALKAIPDDRTIVVEGHTDSRGSDELNMRLSHDRATAVREYLISQGIDASRVQAVGRGESMPVAGNDNAEGRANNRRVEIVIPNAK